MLAHSLPLTPTTSVWWDIFWLIFESQRRVAIMKIWEDCLVSSLQVLSSSWFWKGGKLWTMVIRWSSPHLETSFKGDYEIIYLASSKISWLYRIWGLLTGKVILYNQGQPMPFVVAIFLQPEMWKTHETKKKMKLISLMWNKQKYADIINPLDILNNITFQWCKAKPSLVSTAKNSPIHFTQNANIWSLPLPGYGTWTS